MPERSVAIRLYPVGEAEVRTTFTNTRAAGEGAFNAIGNAADAAATRSEAAADRQLATWRRQAQAAAEAARQTASRDSFDDALSTLGGVNFSRTTGGAREAAEAFGLLEERGGRAGASTMILEHSIRSAADAFASGAPLGTILAEQIGRVGEAAELSGGKLGGLAGVLGGPWGIAFAAGLAILTPFVEGLFESADGSDKAAGAQKLHATAADELKGALDRLNAAQAALNHTTEQGILDDIAGARQERDRTLTALEDARARLQSTIATASAGGLDPNAAAGLGSTMASASAQIAVLDQRISDLGKRVLTGVAELDLRGVAAGTNAATAATQRYDDALDKLTRKFESGHLPGGKAAFDEQALAITKTRDAALAAAKNARGNGAATDIDDQARLAAGANGVARAEAQLAITRRDGAAAVKAGTMTRAEYEAQLESGIRAVNGARQAEKDAATGRRDLAKETREAAAAQRELDAAIAHLTHDFDPVAAAAKNYADRLADIDKALAARKITPEQAKAFRLDAAHENIDDTKAATDKQAQSVFETLSQGLQDAAKPIDMGKLLKFNPNELKNLIDRANPFAGIEAAEADLKRVGDDALDSLADPSRWHDLASVAHQAISQIEQDLIKLALINPLENSLFGEHNPTLGGGGLGGLIGSIGKLFGGGGGGWGGIGADGYASGTDYASAGFHLVGENGPEEEYVPRGAKIMNASDTRRMMAGNDNAPVHNHFHLEGAVVTQDLVDQMNDIGNNAAVRGAAGGRALSSSDSARRARRKLGRR